MFKDIIKYQENKQYKKGLKLCEKILSNNPKQAETYALKALLMNASLKPNFLHYAEKAIELNSDSQMVQHITGIVYKNARNYSRACELLTQAIQNSEEENFNIKRELSYCLIQSRSWDKYIDSRRDIHKNSDATTSVGYTNAIMFGYMMKGDYDQAVRIFNEDVSLIISKTENEANEKSQICGTHLSNLIAAKKIKNVPEFLKEKSEFLLDVEFATQQRLKIAEEKLQIIVKMGKKDLFKPQFKLWFNTLLELMDLNPDNTGYYETLVKILTLTNVEQWVDKFKVIESILNRYSKFSYIPLITKIRMNSEGDHRNDLLGIIKKLVTKGVPSIYKLLKKTYSGDTSKYLKIYEEVLDDVNNKKGKIFDIDEIKPTTFLFLEKLIIEHKFYNEKCNLEDLLKRTEELVEHTPTFLEMNYLLITIAKKLGQFELCEKFGMKLKDYDLNDRWGNNIYAKCLLKVGKFEESHKTIMKIMPGHDTQYYASYQKIWYELKRAKAYFTFKMYPEALCWFRLVYKHYCDFYDDSYDFVYYSLCKKMTSLSYKCYLEWNDSFYFEKNYLTSIEYLLRIYMDLYLDKILHDQLREPNYLNFLQSRTFDNIEYDGSTTYKKTDHDNDDEDENTEDTQKKDPWADIKQYNANYDYMLPKDIKSEVKNLIKHNLILFTYKDTPLHPMINEQIIKPRIHRVLDVYEQVKKVFKLDENI